MPAAGNLAATIVAESPGWTDEVALAGVLAAVLVLLLAAYWIDVPYPITLVLGGLALGFVPGLPALELEPDLVLVLFLPPLLFGAAYFSSLQELRDNLRSVTSLALGLVVATMAAIALVAYALIPGITWAGAFTLGAVLAPTDPVAATAVAGRVGAPRRFVAVVEGESLINDASALVLFKFAVAAVVTGGFSLGDAAGEFVLGAAGGVAIGFAVSWVLVHIRRPIDDELTEIAISLLTPFLAYLPASAAGASAVLAAVTAGIWMGWHAPLRLGPTTRLQSTAVWEVLTFVLNAALFVLLGTQLPSIIADVGERYPLGELALWTLAIIATLLAVRFAWVFASAALGRLLRRAAGAGQPQRWGEATLIGFTGMRGAVSLAAALSIPTVTVSGQPFPERDAIVSIVYAVVLVTIVGQGLLLPLLIRRLGLDRDDRDDDREARARLRAARAALRRLDELGAEAWAGADAAERVKALYRLRMRVAHARLQDDNELAEQVESRTEVAARLRREAIAAERHELVRLRDEGELPADALHRIERDLDLEEARLPPASPA